MTYLKSETIPESESTLELFPLDDNRIKILELCYGAGLNDVVLLLDNKGYINGFAVAKLFGPNTLALTAECLKLPWEEVAAIVGHEIIHLKQKDGTILETLWRLFGLFLVISAFICYLAILQIIENLPSVIEIPFILITFPLALAYLIGMLIFLTIDRRRYWYQIQELRADRLACQIPGVSRQGMINLLNRLKRNEEFFYNKPRYKRYYNRYFELVAHPCLKRRIELIERYKAWGILDYIIHSFHIFKWFFSGKGWHGR